MTTIFIDKISKLYTIMPKYLTRGICNMIKSIRELHEELHNKMHLSNRLNGLFLSEAMGDCDTMRKVIHADNCATMPTVKAFYDYYYHRDEKRLMDDINNIEKEYESSRFQVREYTARKDIPTEDEFSSMLKIENICRQSPKDLQANEFLSKAATYYAMRYKNIFLGNPKSGYRINKHAPVLFQPKKYTVIDFEDSPTPWLDLSYYDVPQDVYITYIMPRPPVTRHYKNVKVIDILREIVENKRQRIIYNLPQTPNQDLNKAAAAIYEKKENITLSDFTKTLRLLNTDLINGMSSGTGVHPSYLDAVALIEDKAKYIFNKIDYPMQFGFYKSNTGQEILTFSYLTTFTQKESFSKASMNRYLRQVRKAPHWTDAQKYITGAIIKNSRQFSHINNELLRLNYIRKRPSKEYHTYNAYYQRDLDRINNPILQRLSAKTR